MQKYKSRLVGVRFLLKNIATAINDILTRIFLKVLRFDKEDFEEIPGLFLQSWCDL